MNLLRQNTDYAFRMLVVIKIYAANDKNVILIKMVGSIEKKIIS